VSDPLNIVPIANDTVTKTIRCVKLIGDILYVLNEDQLDIYDIDPLPHVHYGTVSLPNDGIWMAFKGDYMYLSGSMVYVYSILDPLNPVPVNFYFPSNMAFQIEVQGDYLYMACFDRLGIVDISNPASPVAAGSVLVASAGQFAGYLGLDGQYGYVGGFMPTTICNLYPPDSPTIEGEVYPYPYRLSFDMKVEGNYLFEFGMPFGLQVYRLY